MKSGNHLDRMIDKYIDIASKTESIEVRDECVKRAKMLKEMNDLKMAGETDAERHRRVRDGMAKDELDMVIKKFRGFGR